MSINTEEDVTGSSARELRKRLKLSQSEFWGAIGLTQSGGCRYEIKKDATASDEIPKPYRILIFMKHVAGLDFEVTTPAGASRIVDLAMLQRDSEKIARLREAGGKLEAATQSLKGATNAVNEISASV